MSCQCTTCGEWIEHYIGHKCRTKPKFKEGDLVYIDGCDKTRPLKITKVIELFDGNDNYFYLREGRIKPVGERVLVLYKKVI